MLAAAALAVVLVADDDRSDSLRLVAAGDLRDRQSGFAGQDIGALARLGGKRIVGAQEHVVADFIQMAAELEPRSGRRNVVGRGLALGLDQERQLLEILAVPTREGLQQLQPLAGRRNVDGERVAILGRRHEALLALGEPLGRQFFALRRLELEFLPVGALELLVDRIEAQLAGDRIGGHDFRTGQEGEGFVDAVVAAGEIPVEGADDRIRLALHAVGALPLADAGAAGVRQHRAAQLLEGLQESVALHRVIDALGTRRDEEGGLRFQPRLQPLLRDVGGAADVFIGGIRAAADQRRLQFDRIAFLLRFRGQLGDRTGEIRRVGTDDVRLELGQIDFDDLIVVLLRRLIDFGVRHKQVPAGHGEVGEIGPVGDVQVGDHLLIEGEHRGRGPELRAHVADRAFAGRADRLGAGAEVLDDLVRPALHGEQAAEIEDHVLRRGPTAQLAGQPHADQFRMEHFPGQPGHHFARVRAADADRQHAQAAAVRRMGVGADDQPAGERVVLQDHLMDDAGARLPEPDSVLLRGGREEIVDFPVLVHRAEQVLLGAHFGADQVVAVDRARHGRFLLVGLHELQHGHLGRRVLHRHAIRAKSQHGLAALPGLVVEIVGVRNEHLLGEGQAAAEFLSGLGKHVRHLRIEILG